MIELEITAQGGIQMLHSDLVDLRDFGRIEVTRASHVEFSDDFQQWGVWSAKTGELLGLFVSREAALEWEKSFYSPSGKGWAELSK